MGIESLEVRLLFSGEVVQDDGHGHSGPDPHNTGYPINYDYIEKGWTLEVAPLVTPETLAWLDSMEPSPSTRESYGEQLGPGGGPPETPGEAPFLLSETFFLHSLPGATKTIYLDFDGHVTENTGWNDTENPRIVTPAYSLDSDPAFSNIELTQIQIMWQMVVEDFLPFEVNVTTEDPGVEALRRSGVGDNAWGIRVAIGGSNSDWFNQPAGGVAFLRSFSASTDTPCFVFSESQGNNNQVVVETISHEVGHTVGLSHDGRQTSEYYGGHENGTLSWGPIMGASFGRNITQWSLGEYSGSTNQEDDLTIITTQNGFGYRADDQPSTNLEALGDEENEPNFLQLAEGGASVEDWGIIEQTDDVDVFVFSLDDQSAIELEIKPFYIAPNLDIKATIYRQADDPSDPDVLILVADPQDRLDVEFDRVVLEAGTYFLHIEGVGRGDPMADNPTGYTEYGSLGFYSITGLVDLKTPKPTGLDLMPESDTGVSNTDDITRLDNSASGSGANDKRLKFRVTGTLPGATVRLYAQPANDPAAVPVEIGSIIASSTTAIVTTRGTFDLLDGQHLITARQKLSDLPQSRATEPLAITVDTVAPAVPGLPDMDSASDSGVSNSDDVTNVARPKFNASANHVPTDLLEFHINNVLQSITTSTPGTGGVRHYTFTPATPLPDGLHVVSVRATDVAGNVSDFSTPLGVTIDTVGPVADVEDVTPDPRNTRLDLVRIVFDAPVYGFDISGVTLKRNNGANLLTGAQTLTTFDSQSWVLDNLQPLTQVSGGYVVTVVAPSLVTDLAGNRLLTPATDGFVVDLPKLAISDVTQLESSGVFQFTLSLSTAINEPVTVDYTVGGGNALPGTDYEDAGLAGTVTFSNLATSRTVTVHVLDDGIVEEDELFFVTLSNNSPNVSMFKPMGIGTILNDDLPLVTLSLPDATAMEQGMDPGLFTVTRTGPTSRALAVQYQVSGTATPGADYQSLSGMVTIPVGHSSANIIVRPLEDDEFELPETVTVDLLEIVDSYVTADTGPMSVTILDNDLPRINLVAIDPNGAERGQDPIQFRFTRSGHTTDPLTVDFAVGGTATPGVDFAAIPSQVTFPAGQSVALLNVTPIDDFVLEPDETVVLTVLENPVYAMGLNTSAIAVIDNRELPTVELGVSPTAAPLAYEQNSRAAEFIVRRTSPLDEPLTIFYSITGSATNGVDYVALPTSVTLAPGQSTVILRVQPVDDSPFELDELVTINLAPHATYLTGSTTGGTITIVDNDGGFTEFGGPDRKKAKLTYTDADGDKVTVMLKGPGRGLLYRGFGAADAARIELTGTSGSATSLTIKGGPTSVRQIDIHGSLKQINGKSVDVLEEITSLGPIEKINLKSASGQLRMGSLQSSVRGVSLAVGEANNLSVISEVAFAAISASNWSSSDPAITMLQAPSIGRLNIRGDFTSSLNLTGDPVGGLALGHAAIGGLAGSRTGSAARWFIGGDAPSIIAGAVNNLDVDVLGEYNGITVK